MIFNIIGFAALAHLVADMAAYLELPQKPFQCSLCMGFWISILPMFIMYGLQGILAAALTAITSEILYRLIQRL